MTTLTEDPKPQEQGTKAPHFGRLWFVCKWGGMACLVAAFALAPVVFLLQLRQSDELRQYLDERAALRRAKVSEAELARHEAADEEKSKPARARIDAVFYVCALFGLVGLVAAPIGFLAAPVRCRPIIQIVVGGVGAILIFAARPAYLASEEAEGRAREAESSSQLMRERIRLAPAGALAPDAMKTFERDVVPASYAVMDHERTVAAGYSGASVSLFAGGTILLALAAIGLRSRPVSTRTRQKREARPDAQPQK